MSLLCIPDFNPSPDDEIFDWSKLKKKNVDNILKRIQDKKQV